MTCNCRLAYSRKSDLYSTCNQKACWRLLFDYALEKYKKLGLCPAIELVCALSAIPHKKMIADDVSKKGRKPLV